MLNAKEIALTTLIITLLLFACSCGGGGSTTTVTTPGLADTTASISGTITTEGIETRGTSAAAEPVADAEVWCENSAGTSICSDTTGSDGSFSLEDLPTGEALTLCFRFTAMGGYEDIEGTSEVTLDAGEQLKVERHIRQYDDDGDGTCERIGNGGGDTNLQIRLRDRHEDSSLPDLPDELDSDVDEWDSLPLVPYDDEDTAADEEDHDTSAVDGVPFSVTGLEYLREHHCTELEDGLYIGGEEGRFAWAFYEITGFESQDITSLTVACTPDEGSSYFIGVSNFRAHRWEWSEAVTAGEYTLEVDTDYRHVSLGGRLYFLIITVADDAATMLSAFATPRDVEETDPPVCTEDLTRITGTVLDADGNALPRTHVEVSDGERIKFCRVHRDGSFGFALPDGTFTLTPTLRDYAFTPESAEITLPSEDEITLDFIGTTTTTE